MGSWRAAFVCQSPTKCATVPCGTCSHAGCVVDVRFCGSVLMERRQRKQDPMPTRCFWHCVARKEADRIACVTSGTREDQLKRSMLHMHAFSSLLEVCPAVDLVWPGPLARRRPTRKDQPDREATRCTGVHYTHICETKIRVYCGTRIKS